VVALRWEFGAKISSSRQQSKVDNVAVFSGVPLHVCACGWIFDLRIVLLGVLALLIMMNEAAKLQNGRQSQSLAPRFHPFWFSVCASRLLKPYLNRPMRRETPLWRGSYTDA
jgi:hypothetical protein